jgi:multimeric flavodoxin WrbA
VQKDDMQAIYPEILSADMVVFASPIYYFTLSAQLQAVIHRTYSINIPKNVKKVALIMSSGSAYVYGPAIAQYYQSIVEYWGVENAGIFTANGKQNKSEEKRQELYRFGKSL